MTVAVAPLQEVDPSLRAGEQQYGRSLNIAYDLGRVAMQGPYQEFEGPSAQARNELTATVFEALSSDAEFGKQMRVTKFDKMPTKDGQVVSESGQPIVELVANGYNLARNSSAPAMRVEEHRSGNDLDLSMDVDAMVRGDLGATNSIIAVSASPKRGILEHGLRAMQEVGYEEDLNYVQMYHLAEDGSLDTGSLSFFCDTQTIIRALQNAGVYIPDGTHDDDIITFAVHANFTLEEAKAFALELREACEPGANDKINSVEVLDQCKSEVDMAMQGAYLEIAKSLFLRQKTTGIRQLVSAYVKHSEAYKQEKRQQLIRVNNTEEFDQTAGDIVYDALVYSMAEMVRSRLETDTSGNLRIADKNSRSGSFYDYMPTQVDFYQMIAQWGREGARNNRVYMACGGYFEMSSENDGFSRQDAFGLGKIMEKRFDEDNHGPLVFECTEGHKNRRKPGELLSACQRKGCVGSVGCGVKPISWLKIVRSSEKETKKVKSFF